MEKHIKLLFFIIFIIFNMALSAKSIWDDRAGNIYSRKVYYNEGDSIEIIITENSAIEYKSSSKALKNFKVNITGNEMSGLFDFIPAGDTQSAKNSQDSDRVKINTTVSARVIRVGNNFVTLRGVKQISLNNNLSSFEITGDASLQDISGNTILSTKLSNQVLRITTLLDDQNTVITARDLQRVRINPDSTTDTREETKLSDAKKEDLLLRYFNKLLNLIF